MEMENLGRSFDRSRELGLKRARLEEHIVSRNSNGGREIEGGSDTASIQELASRYRTALAELTFNSKPIITNLTIIAGESLHAAKAIASIICSNILEVPTEQKLPSLYLLDSIVKNIGRDYMKYFASRLPDVFCKAYRQVDPAVQPGMRHLFGTWRNVFPPQALQMIEKELGFPPAVNLSASGTSKPGSQSQRPAQSIHVNPKYLEARQHQQSSKVKGTIADINMSQGNLRDDTEKSERTNLQSARQRADPRLKMHSIQHPPKDVGLATFQQDGSEFGAYDYDPELARHSTAGKTGGRVTEQVLDRAWYESGSNITETTSSQRNGSDIKLGPTNYLASRSANSDANLQNVHHIVSGRSSIGMDKSWKNSEEEEYTWDDMNSRSTTHGVIRKSKRDPRLMDDSERLKNQMTLGSRAPSVGHHSALGLGYPASAQISLGNSEGHPATLTGLSANSNSMVRTSYPLPNNLTFATSAVPDSSGSILQQRYSVEVASPSGQSPMQQRPSQSDTLPRIDVRTTQISGKSNFEMHSQFPQNFPVPDQKVPQTVHRGSVQNLQSIHSQGSSHINSSSQQRHHIPSLQKLQSDPIQYNSSALSHKPVLPQVSIVGNPSTVEKPSSGPSNHSSPEMVGQMSTSSLLTAVMDSGILGKKAVTGSIPKDSYQNAIALPSQASSRPPIPSGASPTQSGVKVASAIPLSLQSHKSTLVSSAQRQTEQLPLPRPHNSVVGSALEQTANVVNIASNPMSSLLNTLVAKGLISASKKESTDPPQIIDDLQNQILGTAMSTTLSVLSAVSPSSMGEQLSLSNPTAKNDDTLHASSLNDIKSHVGFEFKPDVIRVSHPAVINELHDLPHRCSVCSLQVKLKEHLDRHMEWHTLKAKYSSRRWYDSYLDYIKGKDSTHEGTVLKVVSDNKLESGDELMVPADESHCVCVLCGELFEDFYNKKVDQWMFKEAVYLPLSARGVFTSLTGEKGPIVHANCISDSSLRDLGLANDVKAEKERA